MGVARRILRRGRPLIVLAVLPLAGCIGGAGTGAMFDRGTMAPTEVAVTSDLVTVPGPAGWCVDETATRDDGVTAFVLLGNCAAMSTTRGAPEPAVPAVLTAAISAPSDTGTIAESLDGLDTFFRSDEGLALLSRTQRPETVEVLSTRIEGDMFLLHARDLSAGPVAGVEDTYWRAYFDLDRRIATLSVLALEGRNVADLDSLAALRSFANGVRVRNAGGAGPGAEPFGAPAAATPVAPAPPPRTAPQGTRQLFNVGMFRRIFG